MTDLLPCPICGGGVDDSDFFVVVECPTCGAHGPRDQGKDALLAIKMWNQRALLLFDRPSIIVDTTVIEAGSITIGDKDGLHVIIDSNGQRIRNGEEQLWP